jgi:hypothetical protein
MMEQLFSTFDSEIWSKKQERKIRRGKREEKQKQTKKNHKIASSLIQPKRG